MSKTRETLHLGQATQPRAPARDLHHSQGVEVAEIIAATPLEIEGAPSALELLHGKEMAAALAKAERDDEQLATGLYPDKGDPGTVVGLDGVTPTVETAVNGDPKRTDPNPSRR
jgi:hypothetical protein